MKEVMIKDRFVAVKHRVLNRYSKRKKGEFSKMAERINKDNFEEKVLKSSIPVLVDFYSDSCIPCKMIAPVLGTLEEEKEGQLAVYKVNVNYETELTERYGVMGAPTLILFAQGEVKDKKTGAIKKDALLEWIDAQLA